MNSSFLKFIPAAMSSMALQSSIIFNAKFIIFNEQFLISNAKFIILNAKLIISIAKFMIFTHVKNASNRMSSCPGSFQRFLKHSSFLMQISSFLMQSSWFSIQVSSFFMQHSSFLIQRNHHFKWKPSACSPLPPPTWRGCLCASVFSPPQRWPKHHP